MKPAFVALLFGISFSTQASAQSASSHSKEVWRDNYKNTVTATGVTKEYPDHEKAIPGDVIASKMKSEQDAMALWGAQGAKSVKYTGCNPCGVGSKITVIVDFGYIVDTHEYERIK